MLRVTRRVSASDSDAYATAWVRLRDAVLAAGGRAWRFHKPQNPLHHLEFIEWKQSAHEPDVPDRPEVSAACAALDAHFPPASLETWEESR